MLRSKLKAEAKDPRLVIPIVNVTQYMQDQAYGMVEEASLQIKHHGDYKSRRH
jgi:hypothetical protein